MRTLVQLAISFIPTHLRQYVPGIPNRQSRTPNTNTQPSSTGQRTTPYSAPIVPPSQTESGGTKYPEPTQESRAAKTEDEWLNTNAFSKRLGVSDQTVRNWRHNGKIHGVRSGNGYRFPTSQVMPATKNRPKQLVPGLEDVFERFSDTAQAWEWLTTETVALRTRSKVSDTPLQALRRGRRAHVLELADSR